MTATPEAASSYYATTQATTSVLTASLLGWWRRFLPAANWQDQSQQIIPAMTNLANAAQTVAAHQANQYIDALMIEQALGKPTASVTPDSFSGFMASGVPTGSALQSLVSDAGRTYSQRVSLLTAPSRSDRLRVAQRSLEAHEAQVKLLSQAIMADVYRAAEQARTTSERSYAGYMRMVRAGACARCLILAGRIYRWNGDFLRHPQCDCYSVPVAETFDHTHGGLGMPLEDYFKQMPPALQDSTFTKAGAEAIRRGADINQVVNARQGMYSTAIKGVSTNARGLPMRLTPDAIFKVAGDDREKAIALLKANRYIH
jgi:hypothetical protein